MKPSIQFWRTCGITLCCLATTSPTCAQIIPDATLPNNSNVTSDSNTKIITGGTRAGGNLFHSFDEFSVPTGSAAYFNNALDIQNIISRVTGGSVSNIDGLIRANGTANLFLLNPNGIIFGSNASLAIGGSILASTASSLNFADGTQFSATAPQATPLLTVSVPIGLQFGGTAGSILVQGSGNNLRLGPPPTFAFLRGEIPAGLEVQPDKTLALVGGDVTLEGGNLIADGGRIEVGSVAGPGLVSLTPIDFGWALGYSGVPSFQDIQLSRRASVDASGEGGGDIQVQGRRVTLTDGSAIFALTSGSQPGGTVTVNASDSVEVIGTSANPLFLSAVFTDTEGAGAAGELTINTGQLSVRDGAVVTADTLGAGDAGSLTVNADTSVTLSGTTADGQFVSGLFTTTQGDGAAGDLTINTLALLVQNGASVSTSTFGTGKAGTLAVNADTSVTLRGTTAQGLPSALSTITEGAESAGDLTITTLALLVENGAVLTSDTWGSGDAGNLIVNADTSVTLNGTAGKITGLFAQVEPGARGNGGNLTIETEQLLVQNGAFISTASFGTGIAGQLTVEARSVNLENRGAIAATTNLSGIGGDITLQVQDLLLLRHNSYISTTAGIAAAGGNGGNIHIDADLIVAVPFENSDITANSFGGEGGTIDIEAEGIFGLVQRDLEELQTLLGTEDPYKLNRGLRELPSSDITAISLTDASLTGQVTINTPEVDLSQGLIALPEEVFDVTGLIAQGCGAGSGSTVGQFVVTGRGGLPPSPSDPLSSDTVWHDLRPQKRAGGAGGAEGAGGDIHTDSLSEQSPPASRQSPQRGEPPHGAGSPASPAPPPLEAPPPLIVEANGWLLNNQGEVVLTATAPKLTPYSNWLTPSTCHAP